MAPRATIFPGGGGWRLEHRVGRYTSGICGVAGMEEESSSELVPAELLRFENPGLKRPRLKEEENLRSLRLAGAGACVGT